VCFCQDKFNFPEIKPTLWLLFLSILSFNLSKLKKTHCLHALYKLKAIQFLYKFPLCITLSRVLAGNNINQQFLVLQEL